MSQSFPSSLLLENTHARAYRPRGIRTHKEKAHLQKGKKKKNQQYIKCFFFNETNPKVYSQAQVVQFTSMEKTTTSSRQSELTQDKTGLATGGVSSGWHWGWCHWAGHRGSGHGLLLTLPQAGLQVCVHVF